MPRSGGCSCGRVQYRLEGDIGPLVNCHCQFCRRAHGAAFVTVCWVPRAAVQLVAGAEAVKTFGRGDGYRCFCEHCGARLWNGLVSVPEFVSLVVASLDEAPDQRPVMHVNVESKAAWYDILDGAPQHAALPPAARRAIDADDG